MPVPIFGARAPATSGRAALPLLKYTCLSLLLSLTYAASAQQRLSGRVLDATTGQPVPYASISVLSTSQGTTSNAEGEFELRALVLPARLAVSELGHVRDTVAVPAGAAGAPLPIRLRPATVQLPEVQLGTYTEELIKKAYRVLVRSNAQKAYGRAFYRQVVRLDGDATEVQEMVWDAKTSNAGVEGTALAQARFAKKKALISFNDFSVYTRATGLAELGADSATSGLPISLNPTRYFTLRLLGITQNGPQQLVEIGYDGKSSAAPSHCRIVIDAATNQILRFRLETPDFKMKSNNPTFKFKAQTTTIEWTFKPAPNGNTTLDYLKASYDGVLGRLAKSDLKVQVSTFTYFYDGQPSPAAGVTYAPFKAGQSTLAAIKKTTYDAAFWQNSSAVKRTPLEEEVIKSFEQKGAFGTMLTP